MISKKVQFILDNMEYAPYCVGVIEKNGIKYDIHTDYYGSLQNPKSEYSVRILKFKNSMLYGSVELDITETEYHLIKDREQDLKKEYEKQLSLELFGEE